MFFTLIYGGISSISLNPSEKKPFFHFWPGALWVSIGTVGCNFKCQFCQNYEISQASPEDNITRFYSCEEMVDLCRSYNSPGLSYTFNEPTIWFEYTYDCSKLAHKKGLLNNYVTNGYISAEALELIAPYLDAMNIDIKGGEQFYKEISKAPGRIPVFETAKLAKRKGIHLEFTTLVIPGKNDNENDLEEIARFIRNEIGDYPWHITRFFPHYKMADLPPTPIKTLERAHQIGKEEGLSYVYVGNIPGHKFENTWCPNCNELLIERYVFDVVKYQITPDKCCSNCGKKIPIIGEFLKFKT